MRKYSKHTATKMSATPNRDDLPFLISGGGIGGFAAALALARKNIRSHILEQSDDFREVGAGIQLGPNVFRMFHALGITEPINEVAVFPDWIGMNDALSGETITRYPINTPAFREKFEFPYGVIYRPDLHNVLIDACKASPFVEMSLNTKVTGFEDSGDKVQISTEDDQTIDGRALVGADGLWSATRAEIVGDGAPRVSGHIAYRAVLPTNEVPDANRINEVVLWAGPRTHLVHYPLHKGEIFNLVAVFHSERYEEGWDAVGATAEMEKHFAGQHENVQNMLEKIESWRMWVLCDREPIKNWSRGNATLLGDAAHPMLQYLAQGACMAIEDGVCLAGKVASGDNDIARAFLNYQADRYLRTARVQLTARFYGDIYHAAGPTAELRQMMLSGRAPEQSYEGVNWLYNGVDDSGIQQL
jgi:3-hydroxybenzoate 6-monooxygenase